MRSTVAWLISKYSDFSWEKRKNKQTSKQYILDYDCQNIVCVQMD